MRYKTTLLLFFFFLSAFLKGQAAVELEKIQVLLAGIDNPITIAVDDLPDSCISVAVSTGNIKRERNGRYSWRVLLDTNNAVLTLTDRCNNEPLAKRQYSIRELATQILLGARYRSGRINKKDFSEQKGLACIIMEGDVDGYIEIPGFQVYVQKKSGKILEGQNIGARFSGKTLTWVKSVETGDEIIFSKIMYKYPGAKQAKESTETLKFVIK
ncbi:MAG: GldM C-terminal domain [Bacteroidota bacterium]|jgi:hypothetical protein